MISTNLKIIFRSLQKQKLSSLLSVIVLTLGMASFMLIFFFIKYEKSYDESWTESDLIYRIALEKTLENGNITTTANNYAGLCSVMTGEIPGVESATGLWTDVVTAFTPDHFLTDAKFFWGDTSFFKVFDCRFIAGNIENPFPTIQSAVISESAALSLFGRNDPLNERFKLNEGWEYIVSGVFADLPENSHLKVDILISRKSLFYFLANFDNRTSTLRMEPISQSLEPAPSAQWLWQNPTSYTYIRLKKNVDLASVSDKFEAIYQKYTRHITDAGQKSNFILQPVKSIHTGSRLEQELSINSDQKTIAALYLIAFLVLAMSWIIFINFQITQSVERAKEFGLKKVVGASSSNLLLQIILQSVIINIAGIAMAFGVFFLFRGQMENYLGLKNQLSVTPVYLLQFIVLFIAGAILSGIYPAYLLVSKQAQQLLSNKFNQKNDGFIVRRMLIMFQFAASIGLLIATTVIIRQVTFMKNKELGLTITQTAYSYTPMSLIKKEGATQKLISFMDDINRLPGVKSSTVSSCIPGKEINFHSNNIYPAGKPEKRGDNFGILNIDYRFQDVFNPKILAGRMFTIEDQPGGAKLVINREACKKLGFDSPEKAIGQFVMVNVSDYLSIQETPFQIYGVIEDFHQESPRKIIEPLLMMADYRWRYDVGYVTVLFDNSTGNNKVIADLKSKWESFFPNDPFGFQFTSETYQLQMKADEKLAGIFTLYTFLSVLLAALGLFGLAANSTKKRTKEIGIRKVNGATISEILALLNRDYIKWVAIAFVIATPIAYYAMHKWLENFAYKTELSWWIFALAGLLALGIAILTVSWQSWRAATRNPVEALRYE
jgi:putative ABC transport system permease protein